MSTHAHAYRTSDHARYGALGFPLAFVALPLYVMLPAHYGQQFGVSLTALGFVLLGSRLVDAFTDPFLGLWADRRLNRANGAWGQVALCALLLLAGFWAVFFPPVRHPHAVLTWCAITLTLTYVAFSACTITHQAWGSRMGGDAVARARWVAWREGLAVLGVLTAITLGSTWGVQSMAIGLSVTLTLAVLLLSGAPAPALPLSAVDLPRKRGRWKDPWRHAPFRHLLSVYLINGIASAIPATLVVFFINDGLRRPDLVGAFLGGYFLLGALSVPLWVRMVGWLGPSRAWQVGMAGSIVSFVGVLWVGPGDVLGYALVCLAGGLMLGADLTIPGTLLTGVLQRMGVPTGHEPADAAAPQTAQGLAQAGIFTGWWQLTTKLNLALAAGVSLPLLEALGYRTGSTTEEGRVALLLVYGAVPCAFKALALLWCGWLRRQGRIE